MLDTLTRWMLALNYPGIVLLTALENVCPPLPTEPVISMAGLAASQGAMSVGGLIVAGTVGSVLGSLPLYRWGEKIGEDRFYAWCDRKGERWGLSKERAEKFNCWFGRYGGWAIVLGRLTPGVRSLISVPAGITGIGWGRFIFYTTVGSALRMAHLTLLGYFVGHYFDLLSQYAVPATALGLAAVAVWGYFALRKRKPALPADG